MNWYYLKNGQCVGPVPAAEIIRLVREGGLLRSDRVRHDEHGPWTRVAEVPTLRPVARSGGRQRSGIGANYFVAHWRGELSLAQSFWLNAFLPSCLVSAGFFAAVQGHFPGELAAKHWAVLLAMAALVLMPWQFIGAWRAAERRSDPGEQLASHAACFALAAVVAQLFGLFAWSVPFLLPAPASMARTLAPVVPATAAAPGQRAPRMAPAPGPRAAAALPASSPRAPTALELLATIEPFATLRVHAPAEFRAAQDLVERAQRQGKSDQTALAQAARLIQPLAERYMPLAPDAALSGYIAILLRELKALQAKDPALCARFAYPRGSPVQLAEHVDDALLEAERVALAGVIRAAVLRPQKRATFEDVQQDLVGVYRRVAQRHGSAVYRLDQPYETGFDETQLCQVTIDIYGEFQKLAPELRGKVLRFTLGS